ncbi:MAG: Flagellar motor switch protein FliG [Anaerolineae bacterium]|nr:MAG: Flagellar motor switch protein FliG [Anaerolineae bacterium]
MAELNESSGLYKAAVLLLCLGVERSSKVLQYLGESELERVLMAVSEIGTVSQETRAEIMQEAVALSMASANLMMGGVEYSRQLLARAVGPRRGAEILERISASQQLSSFEILRSADPAQVANLLAEEHPQTIALVLSYLEAKLAADIMTHLPPELQVEVTLRLAKMDRVSPNVVDVIERGLKHKLSGVISVAGFRETGGVSFLVKMLNNVDRGVQKTIFEALEPVSPSLVEEIRANMFTFDDLVKLDDKSIQRVLRDVNKQDLALALKGAPEKVRELIYRNLSERARETLQEEVELLGPQLAKNVYAAQRRIVEVVRSLEEAEEIVIGGAGAEYAIIV